jgi:hypothetical protein
MNNIGPAFDPRLQPTSMAVWYTRLVKIAKWALASSPARGRRQLSQPRPAQRGRARSGAGHRALGVSSGTVADDKPAD